MTITVRLHPDAPLPCVSTRAVHEVWLALTAEGFTVHDVDDQLAVSVDVEAPSEEVALQRVAEVYSTALPAALTGVPSPA